MLAMTTARRVIVAVAALAACMAVEPAFTSAQAASEISAVVNRSPITSNDVARRAAFLRLQRQKSDTKTAREQLVEEALKRQEIAKMKMSVSVSDVEGAYARFAASNKLSTDQLTKLLGQAGVGADHFKAYIAVQMSWPRLVNARYGANRGRMSSEELVTRMMENNKQKPVTTEYFLQQIIFVVPDSKRNAILGKRKAEAESARSKFPGCEQSKQFAATMMDVSVRTLGRILAPELPTDWKPLVEKASGTTTATLVTPRGVEFLAICNQRQVSDDFAAEMVFRAEDLGKQDQDGANPNEKKYLDELRSKAQIDYR